MPIERIIAAAPGLSGQRANFAQENATMDCSADLLATAVRHHQAGQLQQAAEIYRQILQTEPQQPQALYYLGVLAHQSGDHAAALDYLQRSIAARADVAASHCMIATVYLALGKVEEAVASCRQALLLQPDYAQAHHNLGIALQTQGNLAEAVASYRHALVLKPNSPETLNNLGGAFLAAGRLEEAIEHYRRALEQKPDYAEAQGNLAHALARQGKFDEAVAAYRRALELRPDLAELHNNFGMTLQDHGDLEGAVECFREALHVRPHFPEAFNNLGYALTELGRLEEAVSSFHRALQLRANYAEALNNLGRALWAQGRLDQAEISFHRALQIRPDLLEAHNNLGSVLQALGRYEEAVASFEKALEQKPDMVEVLNNLGLAWEDQRHFEQAAKTYRRLAELQPKQPCWALRVATLTCPDIAHNTKQIQRYRHQLENDLQQLGSRNLSIPLARWATVGSKPPFQLMYQGQDDRRLKEAFAEVVRRSLPASPPPAPARSSGLPRIGFVVTQGHEGIFLRFMRGILEHLDRSRFAIAVICAPAGEAAIRAAVAHPALEVLTMPIRVDLAAQRIRAAGFDLLYYWEIGTDATNYVLPMLRPAAVQCTSWGMPVTSGIAEVDYYLSSRLLEDEAAASHYTEELVRLETLPTYYYRPSLPEAGGNGTSLEPDEHRHRYFCPQSLLKFHPEFDPLLAGILRRDTGGELLLIEGPTRPQQALLARWQKTLPDCLPRIRLLPRRSHAEFLGLMSQCDVVLDPLHVGGGNTTYEALGLGLPIVTLPSAYLRGRVTYGCYQKMGVLDCVASNPRSYVETAVRLGTDRAWREEIRARIAAAAGMLFEDHTAVSQLEDFFEEVIRSARS